ncbi:MAG: hypothetical protein RMK01_08100 [Thermomicrobium sp.]|nr:hypothetical protein [Thermomicrobium sp.]
MRHQVLRIHTDYGPIGEGASRAHVVLANNGTEYIVKGHCFSPEHPFVAVNEYIAASLAEDLGLPALDWRLVDVDGCLCYASTYLVKGSFYPWLTAELLDACENRDYVYDMVAFDAWLCNADRHQGNILVRLAKPSGTKNDQRFLVLNDHSHALLPPGFDCDILPSAVNQPVCNFVQIDFVKERIVSRERLEQAIKKIELLPEDRIVKTVQDSPEELWPDLHCRELILDFLLKRRSLLRSLFDEASCFPKLEGGGQ